MERASNISLYIILALSVIAAVVVVLYYMNKFDPKLHKAIAHLKGICSGKNKKTKQFKDRLHLDEDDEVSANSSAHEMNDVNIS